MNEIIASLRLVVFTMIICVVGYSTLILSFAQVVTPSGARGSLIKDKYGKIVGSKLIAQKFTDPRYFWARPSAVDYNASATGASNKSPTSRDLTDRAIQIVKQFGASANEPLPAELVAASGSGIDPHITEEAALYQVSRVAKARGMSEGNVTGLVKRHAFNLGRFMIEDRLINVLELNLALDDAK